MTFQESNYTAREPKEIMAEHGKSFYWASHLFSKSRFQDVALLYAFCRYVDDTADETEQSEAKGALASLKQDFYNSERPFIRKVRMCFSRLGINAGYGDQLISGAEFDVNQGEIKTHKDLLVYCYKVAGVVGLMMCPVIGVNKDEGDAFALDLGIGMQLTNICRDILEDAQNDRCYLPQDELEVRGILRGQLRVQGETPQALKTLLKYYLDIADEYYESGSMGYCHIPFRPRLAILVAAKVYQAIGKKIRRNDYNVLAGRTFLGSGEKLWVTAKALFGVLHPNFWTGNQHRKSLHQGLRGLPGVH